MNRKANAVLVNYMCEREALSIVKWAADSMHYETGNNFLEYCVKCTDSELQEFFLKMTDDGLATPLEYVPMVWRLTNVSRALQQQLTRYRVGMSFCIESMRVVNKDDFASKGQYHVPSSIVNNSKAKLIFDSAMHSIENMYNDLIENGCSEEDARGILPLNIFSTITFSANFRSVMHILSTRSCLKTQGEFRDLSDVMVSEINKKMGSTIAKGIKKPCESGKCLMMQENITAIEAVVNGYFPRRPICPLFKKNYPAENKCAEQYVDDFTSGNYSRFEMKAQGGV